MPNNYVLLEKITVGAAGAASVTFANIPQTGYTDLVLKSSARSNRAASEDGLGITVNSASSGYTYRILSGNGSSASSVATAYEQIWAARLNGNTTTSNTFTNSEFYFPNYTSSTAKSYSGDTVTENNATEAFATMSAILQSSTSAISSLTIQAINGSLMANSTFYLYGVAKLGTTPAIAPKAAGGDIVDTDGTYWYHTFLSSGTFTPAANLTTDYLVVAGGGGGGLNHGAGGGAGGLRSTVTATGGGGSLESAISVAANTAYPITVGAGGTGGSNSQNGSNSVFSTITAVGGGSGADNQEIGVTGGSGGGGSGNSASGGAGTTNQGYAGGTGSPGDGLSRHGGGGGGAFSVGAAATNSQAGTGGSGVATSISGTSVTYAGGGGGGGYTGTNAAGGTGGGGTGKAGTGATAGDAGTANRGAGGGGGSAGGGLGGNGGSGIVIVRYLVA